MAYVAQQTFLNICRPIDSTMEILMDRQQISSVLVTGADGNLGSKLIQRLVNADWCRQIVAVDRGPSSATGLAAGDKVRWVEADLTDGSDRKWIEAVQGVDAVVHLAAQAPSPDASWREACASFDMTCHILGAAVQAGVKRAVFASSNHVMGQYKDPPLADDIVPGGLCTSLPPGPGTRWFNGQKYVQGFAYASSKLMGERLCRSMTNVTGGALTTVSVRIGWCQNGENLPGTINTTGVPGGESTDSPDAETDLRWFRNMWLSNRDFINAVECALLGDESKWPSRSIVVNAMSGNVGMPWDIEYTRRMIGYNPQDNAWDHLT
jgi:NAD(P)-dependent dehydrogenase (short-subunit alcohol dehydrogenase family)